jgi:hypothetical protein
MIEPHGIAATPRAPWPKRFHLEHPLDGIRP